ncbi:ABC transporter permease [Candidatus Neomarinimicrobiota bacterium]
MFYNYLITAIRNLRKGLVSALSQSFGLAIGIAVFILVIIIANYEENFDTFFNNYERIYTVYVQVKPESGYGLKTTEGVQTAFQPVLEINIPEIEKSSRLLGREFVVKSGEKKFYQAMSFADPDFLDIFQINFIQGAAKTALGGPGSVIISKSTAEKYFGDENPIGEIITVDNSLDMQVTAVFADLPANSHFTNSITGGPSIEMLGAISALTQINDFDPAGSWNGLRSSELTYVLLPEGSDPTEYENKLAQIAEQHLDTETKEFVEGFHLRPLENMNLFVWETSGIPALAAIRVVGLMILLIACLNYMTMAAARGLYRLREVGLRKALGATQGQLIGQFLMESVVIAFFALILALLLVKLAIPVIGALTTRELTFELLNNPQTLSGLAILMLITGLFAGGYPAWVISRIENGFHIFIMDSDGSNIVNLTPDDPDCSDPLFSPDGNQIVFPSGADNASRYIHIMDIDGSNEVQLGHGMKPTFSPDGSKIVFKSSRSGEDKIYIMNADGSQQTKISDTRVGNDPSPSFTPSGDRVAFSGSGDAGDIYIVGVDGSGLTNLTNNNGFYDYNPSITPDGLKIVFSRKEDVHDNWDIYIMNIDGTGDTNLTNNLGHSQFPKVSPNGTKILYLSLINNDYEVYIMNIDGTDITNLTNSPGVDENPQFQP